MRIAIVVFHFPPVWMAGTELATQQIALELAKLGHEVHILTTLDEGLPLEENTGDYWIHRINFHGKLLVTGSLRFLIQMLPILRKINPDIIHTQSIILSWMGGMAGRLQNVPHVTNGQGSDIYANYPMKSVILRLNLSLADEVIVLTMDMENEIKKIKDRPMKIIPNGVDVDRFKHDEMSNEFPEDETNRIKVITFVGTLRKVKGVDQLIRAVYLVKNQYPNMRLVLVGDGVERKYLEKMVEEYSLDNIVHFVGKVDNENIPRYLAVSDLFVLPSLYEGFGLVILEAMASGLPIICTNTGGLPCIVKQGENGFLVEPSNPQQLAEQLLVLLRDEKLRLAMSKNNVLKAQEYAWSEVTKKIESVYIETIKKR